tara:strand:- start:558 stop:731 length:174 start_codon:yes stop_codon:yes gene_type:complete
MYCVGAFVLLDPIWIVAKITEAINGTEGDRMGLLCVIPVKLIIDLSVYLPIYENTKD